MDKQGQESLPMKQDIEEGEDDGLIQLNLYSILGRPFVLLVPPDTTVRSLKVMMERLTGISSACQHLMYQSKKLEDSVPISNYNIDDGCMLKFLFDMQSNMCSMYEGTSSDSYDETLEEFEGMSISDDSEDRILKFREGFRIREFLFVVNSDETLSPTSEHFIEYLRRGLFKKPVNPKAIKTLLMSYEGKKYELQVFEHEDGSYTPKSIRVQILKDEHTCHEESTEYYERKMLENTKMKQVVAKLKARMKEAKEKKVK